MIAGRDALSRYLKRTAALALLLALTPAAAAAQQGRLATGNWTRGLVGGWGHSWTPGYGKTKSDVQFVAFHPQLGRFVTNHLELYGEGTLFLLRPTGDCRRRRRGRDWRALPRLERPWMDAVRRRDQRTDLDEPQHS